MCVCVCADAESTLLDSFVMKGTLLIENTVEDGTVVDVNRFDDSSLALTQMKTMTLRIVGFMWLYVRLPGMNLNWPARQRLLLYSYVCARMEPQPC